MRHPKNPATRVHNAIPVFRPREPRFLGCPSDRDEDCRAAM